MRAGRPLNKPLKYYIFIDSCDKIGIHLSYNDSFKIRLYMGGESESIQSTSNSAFFLGSKYGSVTKLYQEI